jgi:hypothetical protein
MKGFAFLTTGLWLLVSGFSNAILDTNSNGLSDLWEKQHNSGNLFPNTFLAINDEDQDGWTNAKEAIAGTDPFKANPPDGIVAITITPSLVPGAFTLTWPTLIGKNYQLKVSSDLVTWTNLGDPITSSQKTQTIGINTTQPDTTIPPKVFWQVAVTDLDTDGDGLTDAEENELGTSPFHSDTDGDLISDRWEQLNGTNPSLADSDGDGANDLEEQLTGKDANSSTSHTPTFVVMRRSVQYFSNFDFALISDWNSWTSSGNYLNTIDAGLSLSEIMAYLEGAHPFTTIPQEGAEELFYGATLKQNKFEESPYYTIFSDQLRVWCVFDAPPEDNVELSYLEISDTIYDSNYAVRDFDVIKKTHRLEQGEVISEYADVKPEKNFPGYGYQEHWLKYAPLLRAPEVLSVNSDYDEGRVDPTTGYAIPDCDDADSELLSMRDHLSGQNEAGDLVFDDLHPGWFGLSPTPLIDDQFFENTTITIKKLAAIDPVTGYLEDGHVRFYAVESLNADDVKCIETYDFDTLAAVNLVQGGIKNNSGESVYGENSLFSMGTKFFMEGVHPGYITLEWRYQKGDVDISFQQRFLVCTQKSATAWKNELAYKIRLETSNDPSGIIDVRSTPLPSEDYWNRIERISEYYDFYQECFKEPLRSHPTGPTNAMSWPGLARLAGSQVVSGLSDSEYGKMILSASNLLASLLPGGSNFASSIGTWTLGDIHQLQHELFTGGKNIFRSIGWQMHAFRNSGFWAHDWVDANDGNDVEASAMIAEDVWTNLYFGIKNHDAVLLNESAYDITDREQNITIVDTWTNISALGAGFVDDMFTVLAKNSMSPFGDDFRDLYPATKSLANTADRWDWIQPTTATGVLNTWNTAPIAAKHAFTYSYLVDDGKRFSSMKYVTLIPGYPSPTLIPPILCNDDKDIP